MLKFSRFCFDTEQQVLYLNGEVVPLTVNQSKMLTLFLSDPAKVFSKDEILDAVWDTRAVSEQVVFQNISQLRGIIGSQSIKTFPRRGYQWQLPPTLHSEAAYSDISVGKKNLQKSKLIVVSVMIIGLLLLIILLWWQADIRMSTGEASTEENIQQGRTIQLIPFVTPYQNELQEQVTRLNQFLSGQAAVLDGSSVGQDVDKQSVQEFFNSPFVYRQSLGFPADGLLLSGYVHVLVSENAQRTYLVEYLIQGEQRAWQGYLQTSDLTSAQQQMAALLSELTHSGYFSLVSDAFVTAELSRLQSRQGQNLDVLKHLVERQLQEGNYQVASGMIEQMRQFSQQQGQALYTAYSYWLEGQLLSAMGQDELAMETLHVANTAMTKLRFLPLQSEINKTLAEVQSYLGDFQTVRQYLFEAASQARIADRPVQEIRAYTLLSIKASKMGQHQAKYDYLTHAKKLLVDYQLDASHFMLPFYHLALFAETDEKREHFFKTVLEQPVTPKNYWVFFSATEFLVELYIKQENWQKASVLTENIQEAARQAYLRSKIFLAMADEVNAKEQAFISFNVARTQRIEWVAREVALLLLELRTEQDSEADLLMYRRYIENHNKPWWGQKNFQRLRKVGIKPDPYEAGNDI